MHYLDKEINKLTHQVIGAAFDVSNNLGPGFAEKIYERALMIELKNRNVNAVSQILIPVKYNNIEIGHYIADILVNNKILVELKCVEELTKSHMAQCINYLAATGLKICLLINFYRRKLEWKRVIFDI